MPDAPLALTAESTVQAVEAQVSADLGAETVILHLASGIYFGLDEVGTCVWKLLDQPRTVAWLRDQVVARFEVEPERCEADLLRLFGRMAEKGLVIIS